MDVRGWDRADDVFVRVFLAGFSVRRWMGSFGNGLSIEKRPEGDAGAALDAKDYIGGDNGDEDDGRWIERVRYDKVRTRVSDQCAPRIASTRPTLAGRDIPVAWLRVDGWYMNPDHMIRGRWGELYGLQAISNGTDQL